MSETAPAAPDAAPVVPALNIPAEAITPPAGPPQEGANPESTPEQSGDGEGQDDKKPRQRASERIGEIYGKMKAAERERDLALAELERYRKPVVDQATYDQLSYDQQQAVQIQQAVRSVRAEELEAEARRRHEDAAGSRADMFRSRIESVKDQIPDIDVVVTDPTLPVSPVGARFIQESDRGPQVAYWLAQNRADAARIASLDPLTQAYELGRIEQRITAAPVARKVSQAPAPVPKVGGGGSAGAKDPASMSMSEYSEWYRKRGR